MGADLERARGLVGDCVVVDQRGLYDLAERGRQVFAQDLAAGFLMLADLGSDRIGGIGREQQRRAIAPTQRALEFSRHLDAEQHGPRLEQLIEFGRVVGLTDDPEIGRVLDCL